MSSHSKIGSFLVILFFLSSCLVHCQETCGESSDSCQSDELPTFTMRDVNVEYQRQYDAEFGPNQLFTTPPYCNNSICPGLGNGFYLPSINAISALTSGTPIFLRTKLGECSEFVPRESGTSEFSFTKDTQDLLDSFGRETGISGSVSYRKFSFSTSFESATKYTVTSSENVMSSVMQKNVITGDVNLLKTPPCQGSYAQIADNFLAALKNLALQVPDYSNEDSWNPYMNFMKKYGSHIVTGLHFGSKFQRWDSLISTSTSMQREMQAKSCAEIEGPIPGGGWSVSTCSTFTEEEKRNASRLQTRSVTNIVGGRRNQRLALISRVTEETLDNFIKSATAADEPIGYQFTSVWDMLSFKYENDTEMLQRAENLKVAYELVNAFGCPVLWSRISREEGESKETWTGIQSIIPTQPQGGVTPYSCYNKKDGCCSDYDCHQGSQGGLVTVCFCYGDGCLDSDESGRVQKRTTKSGGHTEGVNGSCYWHGIKCHCDLNWNGGRPSRKIWP